jgi:tetratricopeptide (TPR) repeat protein
MEIAQESFAPPDSSLAWAYFKLALAHKAQGHIRQLIVFCSKALEAGKRTQWPDAKWIRTVTNELAIAYANSGQPLKAERLFLATIELSEKDPGLYDSILASALYNLGVLYGNQKRFDEAEPLLKRCLDMRLRQYGLGHPQVEGSRKALSLLQSMCRTGKEVSPAIIRSALPKVQEAR